MSYNSIPMEFIETKEKAILNLVLKPLVEAYNLVKQEIDIATENENSITSKLVNCLKTKTSVRFLYQKRLIPIVMRPKEHDTAGKVYEPDMKFMIHGIVWIEIEAKRIYEKNNWRITEYFDEDNGISRFLNRYSQSEDYAGMVSYIQNGDFYNIIQRIKAGILELSYKDCENVEGIENCLLSFHQRIKKSDIRIYHLFFCFS